MKNSIKKYRLENKLTQEKLARECNITLRQMQNIENNRSIPRVDTAIKLKQILKIKNIEELFNIDE